MRQGCHHSSVDLSAPTVLLPRFKSQAHHLRFLHLQYLCYIWYVKRTKINKKRPCLAHFLKKIFQDVLGSNPKELTLKTLINQHEKGTTPDVLQQPLMFQIQMPLLCNHTDTCHIKSIVNSQHGPKVYLNLRHTGQWPHTRERA